MLRIKLKFLLILFSFIFINAKPLFASTSKCPYSTASIYFKSPSIVISEYSPDYYCWDIVYLKQNNLGNISLNEYKEKYPEQLKNNFEFLRKIGITPDIVNEFIDEEVFENFSSKDNVIDYIKSSVTNNRSNISYIIAVSKEFEENPDMLEDSLIGDILNKDKKYKFCSKIQDDGYEMDNSLYLSDKPTYRQIIQSIPSALRPSIIYGNKLINIFGMEMATLKDNRALGKEIREINFTNRLFETSHYTTIGWNEQVCRPNTLQEIATRNSTCHLCPYIIMIFNEISYIFNYMYNAFKDIILVFLVIFGALFMAFEFAKGFGKLPFDADFSNYPKAITDKMKVILITLTILLVPPKHLFEWTVDPVINLTIGISETILQIGNTDATKFTCDATGIVDKMNEQRQIIQNEQITPPIVKKSQIKATEQLQDSVIIPKSTMGNIICFLTNTLEANGRQMTMGEILMKDLFNANSTSEHKFIGFLFGIVVFFLYFFISFMIGFYILDGLLQFFKLAIMWPFYIFGYAFNFAGFNIKEIIDVAKNFGLIMINLAVFSMFNSALLNSFYFGSSKENIMQIVNKAIETNDTSIITNSIPVDLLSISKFLFIIYCIYYLYAKLGELAASYGGKSGELVIGAKIKNLFDSTKKTFFSVSHEDKMNVKKEKEIEDSSQKEKTTITEEIKVEGENV